MTVVVTPTLSGNWKHFGLREIFTEADDVTVDNVVEVIGDTFDQYTWNKKQIMELQDIYKGDHIILHREPTDNQPYNERVNMNLFPALATAWVGLILGEKTDYVFNGKKEDADRATDMEEVVMHIRHNNDVLLDKEILYDLFICGVSYQFSGGNPKGKLSPTQIANIPVESCYVVKTRDIGHPVVASVIVGESNKKKLLTVFTDTRKIMLLQDSGSKDGYKILSNDAHRLPQNPIQEIRLNPDYLSMVAQGESAQNALNMAMSESINDTIFQMRSMLFITGTELTDEQATLAKKHGILTANPHDGRQVSAEYLTKPLDETINSLRGMLFDVIYFIMGIPKSDGGTSGNTGAAVVASGMQTMDLIAYSVQLEMRKAKAAMLDNIIEVLKANKLINSDINAMYVDIAFDRQLVMNIVEAADAFSKLKESGFPNKDNLKVTKLTSDVDKVAKEMDRLAEEQARKVAEAVQTGLNNNSGTGGAPANKEGANGQN